MTERGFFLDIRLADKPKNIEYRVKKKKKKKKKKVGGSEKIET